MINVEGEINKYFVEHFNERREVISPTMPYVKEWSDWYKGKVSKFHRYFQYNGKKKIYRERKSLGMAKVAAETWANLLLNEKTDVILPDKDKELLDKIFQRNNFWKIANETIEKSFALGTAALVIRVINLITNRNGEVVDKSKAKIVVESISAQKIYPITIESGKVVECAFVSFGSSKGVITIHLLNEESQYEIHTLYYEGKDGNLNFTGRTSIFKTLSNYAWFTINKPNIVNNIDVDSPLGISIFANSIDQLKAIDTKYDSFDNEFYLGKKRMFASSRLFSVDENGDMVVPFDDNDIYIYQLPANDKGENYIQFDTSTLRATDHIMALNGELSMFSFSCGFGKAYFIFSSESAGRPIQTATGIIAQNTELFRSMMKHEIIIRDNLIDIVQAIIVATNTFTNNKFSDKAIDSINIQFDDSIFEDKDNQKAQDRQDLQLGLLSKIEYRVRNFGETFEDAQAKLNEDITYLASNINALLPALQAKTILPKEFVRLIYGKEDPEIIEYITDNLENDTFDAQSLINSFGGTEGA